MVKRFGKRAAARMARTIGWRRAKHEAQALATASTLLTCGTEGHGDTDPTLPLVRKASPEAVPCRTLRVYFIKPSKYDEQGYVLRFRKGVLPNNTLTALAALNEAYNRLRATQNVFVETVLWDELVEGAISGATIQAIKAKAKEDGVEVLIGLAGVQTNQYPRGRDLALQFVAVGFPVIMGGSTSAGTPSRARFSTVVG